MSVERQEFANGVPLQVQIYSLIRDEILDGLFIGKDSFPGEMELAQRFGVSVITSRGVLQRLEREGLVERGRGRRARALFAPDLDSSEATMPAPDGSRQIFDYTVLNIAETIAPWRACQAFGVDPGAVFWQCLRLRSIGGKPHSVTMSVQPIEIGRRHDITALPTTPMPTMLARSGHAVVQADRTVGVARPPADVGTALGVTVWERLLLATVKQFTAERRIVEWTRFFYHPDQIMPLERFVHETM